MMDRRRSIIDARNGGQRAGPATVDGRLEGQTRSGVGRILVWGPHRGAEGARRRRRREGGVRGGGVPLPAGGRVWGTMGGLDLYNHVPSPPPKKKPEKYFSGNYYVKFGHFRAKIV